MTCRAFHCRKQLGHSTWLSRSRGHHGRGHGWRGDYVKSSERWLPGCGGVSVERPARGYYLNVTRLEWVGLLGYRMWAYHRNEGKGNLAMIAGNRITEPDNCCQTKSYTRAHLHSQSSLPTLTSPRLLPLPSSMPCERCHRDSEVLETLEEPP
jgi:hypothetical protein